MEKEREWHLDKRVPVAVIMVLIAQFAVGAYVAGTMNSQIKVNERDIEITVNQIESIRASAQTQAIQLGRIEENITGLREDLRRAFNELKDSNK